MVIAVDEDQEASRLASEVYDFCAWLIEDGADSSSLIIAMTAALVHITNEHNEVKEQTTALLSKITFGGGGTLH